jgi:hypothetical protein
VSTATAAFLGTCKDEPTRRIAACHSYPRTYALPNYDVNPRHVVPSKAPLSLILVGELSWRESRSMMMRRAISRNFRTKGLCGGMIRTASRRAYYRWGRVEKVAGVRRDSSLALRPVSSRST